MQPTEKETYYPVTGMQELSTELHSGTEVDLKEISFFGYNRNKNIEHVFIFR